jgi:hypothetical protein
MEKRKKHLQSLRDLH